MLARLIVKLGEKLGLIQPSPKKPFEDYGGFKGGLYPDGKNDRPPGHEKAAVALAKEIQPLDADGKPSPDGKIVIMSVGMSNTTQVYTALSDVWPMPTRTRTREWLPSTVPRAA